MQKKNEFWATAQVYCKARQPGVHALGTRWARAERAGGRACARGRGRKSALGRAGGRGAKALGAGARVAGARELASARTRADAQESVARAAGERWVGARGRARRQARARAERAGQGWLGAGRAGWPWAVHSVHSACFWPGSTRYFPESKFLDIVREPGS